MNREQAVKYLSFSGFSDEQIKAIEGAFSCPSAGIDCEDCPAYEKKTGWIPVSESLPEEKQSVLVWCPEYKNMYCAYLENKNWWIFGAFSQIIPNAVIAWMPLPEPYKAEGSDKE